LQKSPAFAASRAGNAAAIPILASAGADVTGPWGANGWAPLEHAVHKRQAGSIKALLDEARRLLIRVKSTSVWRFAGRRVTALPKS
jgi:hypothetical protein